MTPPNPSSEWSPEDRLQVVAWITHQMEQATIATKPVRHLDLLQYCDRLKYVTTADGVFLQANRDQILNG